MMELLNYYYYYYPFIRPVSNVVLLLCQTYFNITGLPISCGINVKFHGIFRDKFVDKSANFAGIFEANFTKKQLVKNGQFCSYFQGKFRYKSIDSALTRQAFLTFF